MRVGDIKVARSRRAWRRCEIGFVADGVAITGGSADVASLHLENYEHAMQTDSPEPTTAPCCLRLRGAGGGNLQKSQMARARKQERLYENLYEYLRNRSRITRR